MRVPFKFMMLLLGGALLTAAFVLVATQAEAQSVSAKVGVPLKEALDLANKKDFRGALAKAREADATPGKTAFDTYSVNQLLAYIYANTGDYAGVARALEAQLATGQVPANERAGKVKASAQAYYRAGNYTKGISLANQYIKQYGNDADMQLLISQGYFVNNDFEGAKTAAMQQIRASQAAGRRPDENSLKLLLSAAYKSNDRAASRQAMLWLVEYYPSPEYWNDLLNLMQQQAGSDVNANLEVFRLKSATQSMRRVDDYVEAAQIAIQAGFPGDAQRFMEQGYAAGVLGASKGNRDQRLLDMAKSQAAADRRQLPASAGGSAAAMVATGQAYLSYGMTDKAIAAFQGAIAKGAKDDGNLHLGRAYLAAGNKAQARTAFGNVGGKNADLAKLWAMHAQR